MVMMFVDEIYDKLSKLPYGFWDKTTNGFMAKAQMKDPDYVGSHMRVQTPQETIKRGGNCWDTSLCVAYYAHKAGLSYIYVFTERDDGTHSFCMVQEQGHWYHVEPSDGKYMGVHGPFRHPDNYLYKYVKGNKKLHGNEITNVRTDVDIKDFWRNKNLDVNTYLRRFGSKFAD